MEYKVGYFYCYDARETVRLASYNYWLELAFNRHVKKGCYFLDYYSDKNLFRDFFIGVLYEDSIHVYSYEDDNVFVFNYDKSRFCYVKDIKHRFPCEECCSLPAELKIYENNSCYNFDNKDEADECFKRMILELKRNMEEALNPPPTNILLHPLTGVLIALIVSISLMFVMVKNVNKKPNLEDSKEWIQYLEKQDKKLDYKTENVVEENQTEPISHDFEYKPKDVIVETKPVEVELIKPSQEPKDVVQKPLIQQKSKRARSKLGLARSYLAAKHIDIKFEEKARKIFVSIINDYPKTKSAELAKKELEKMK